MVLPETTTVSQRSTRKSIVAICRYLFHIEFLPLPKKNTLEWILSREHIFLIGGMFESMIFGQRPVNGGICFSVSWRVSCGQKVGVAYRMHKERNLTWQRTRTDWDELKSVSSCVLYTLPETNISPENRQGDAYGKSSFLGAMLVSGSVHIKIDSGYLQYNCYPGYTFIMWCHMWDEIGCIWIFSLNPFWHQKLKQKKTLAREHNKDLQSRDGKPMEALQYTKTDLAELSLLYLTPESSPNCIDNPPTLNSGNLPSLGSLKYNSISYFVVESDWRFNHPSAKQKPAEINVVTSDSGNEHRNRYQSFVAMKDFCIMYRCM